MNEFLDQIITQLAATNPADASFKGLCVMLGVRLLRDPAVQAKLPDLASWDKGPLPKLIWPTLGAVVATQPNFLQNLGQALQGANLVSALPVLVGAIIAHKASQKVGPKLEPWFDKVASITLALPAPSPVEVKKDEGSNG